MGHIYVFLTATRTEWTGEGGDEYLEDHGWVDPRSRYDLYESRNDVAPVADWPEDDPTDGGAYEDLLDAVNVAFNALPGGPESDEGRGTFYSADTEDNGGLCAYPIPAGELDTDNQVSYSYAIHFSRKHNDPVRGWVEDDWHPVTDGGLNPSDIGL